MLKQEILQKAIEKAVNNGWLSDLMALNYIEKEPPHNDHIAAVFADGHGHHENFLFRHDFLRAFFGEEEIMEWKEANHLHIAGEKITPCSYSKPCSIKYLQPAWLHHAQQMVISEDPIEYLSKFI